MATADCSRPKVRHLSIPSVDMVYSLMTPALMGGHQVHIHSHQLGVVEHSSGA